MVDKKEEIAEAPKEESQVLADIKKENLELQAELQKREEMLHKRDEIKAREMLSGKSAAGTTEKKPETPKEYAARIMRGEK